MSEQKDLSNIDEFVRDIMLELMAVLWSHGYTEIPTGALMRLLGVDKEHANRHEGEYILLDKTFSATLAKIAKTNRAHLVVPPDTVIH